MIKNKEVNKSIEHWVPNSRSVSEMETIIHSVGKDLALALYKIAQSEGRENSYIASLDRVQFIKLELINHVKQKVISVVVRIDRFFTRYLYSTKIDSKGRISLHEIIGTDYIEKVNDSELDIVRFD